MSNAGRRRERERTRKPGRTMRVSLRNVCPEHGVREYGRAYLGRFYCLDCDATLGVNDEEMSRRRAILESMAEGAQDA